jgi:hypothetical protein
MYGFRQFHHRQNKGGEEREVKCWGKKQQLLNKHIVQLCKNEVSKIHLLNSYCLSNIQKKKLERRGEERSSSSRESSSSRVGVQKQ